MAHHPLHISSEDSALPAAWYTSDNAEVMGIARPPLSVIDTFAAGRKSCSKGAMSSDGGGAKVISMTHTSSYTLAHTLTYIAHIFCHHKRGSTPALMLINSHNS